MIPTSLLALTASSIVQFVSAAPRPNFATYNSDPADIATTPVYVSGIPGATGSLRGGIGLAGYNPSNPVNPGPSTISSFQVAPAQTQDPDLGLYLDLQNLENPQPVRGSPDAPTDPGPRAYNLL